MQSPAASRTGRNRWCHIPPGGGPYYTAEEEEALKGQIMQCEGKCTVTRGNCYQSCGATKSTKTQPCSVGAAGGAACHATCDSSFGSCNRWCHIPPGGGPYYTAEEEEALKTTVTIEGQIMQCEGKCTVTRGNCYQSCGATKSTKTQRSANGCDCSWIANDDLQTAATAPGLPTMIASTRIPVQSPAASRTGRLALLGRQVVQHAMQRAVSCRQSHGSPCSVGAAGGAACHATCDSTFGSCNRWCHIPPGATADRTTRPKRRKH